jgi:hypothetical protein
MPEPIVPKDGTYTVEALRDGEWFTASSGWMSDIPAIESARILSGTLGWDVVVVDPYGNDIPIP